ncbi:actin-related protein 2/3 complex subunit 2B isoform X1, partial [Tanacetum coccineum]
MACFERASPALKQILLQLYSADKPLAVEHQLHEFGSLQYHVQPAKLTAIFPIRFKEESDVVIAKAFFQELVDVGSSGVCAKAPPCYWSPIPPPELRGEPLSDLSTNGGFVSFDIYSHHVEGKKLDKTVWNLLNFNALVKYHVKSTKGFVQRRMRSRLESLVEALQHTNTAEDHRIEKVKATRSYTSLRKQCEMSDCKFVSMMEIKENKRYQENQFDRALNVDVTELQTKPNAADVLQLQPCLQLQALQHTNTAEDHHIEKVKVEDAVMKRLTQKVTTRGMNHKSSLHDGLQADVQVLGANMSALGLSQKPTYAQASSEPTDRSGNDGFDTLETVPDAVPSLLTRKEAHKRIVLKPMWSPIRYSRLWEIASSSDIPLIKSVLSALTIPVKPPNSYRQCQRITTIEYNVMSVNFIYSGVISSHYDMYSFLLAHRPYIHLDMIYGKHKGRSFGQESSWEILRASLKRDAPDLVLIPTVNLEGTPGANVGGNAELFGEDKIPRPPGARAAKNTKYELVEYPGEPNVGVC